MFDILKIQQLQQPEFPVLKRNIFRKQFITEHKNWPVWFEVPEADEIYYIYILGNCGIVVCDYKVKIFKEHYDDDFGRIIKTKTKTSQRYYLVTQDEFLNNCKVNISELVSFFRNYYLIEKECKEDFI